MLLGEFPNEPGYRAAFSVEDAKSGLEIELFNWWMNGETTGSESIPNDGNIAKLRRKK